jgi:hypothetical protein
MFSMRLSESETLFIPVICFLVNDPADTTSGIAYVSLTPGNNVHMRVADRLPGGHAIIYSDIEPIRFQPGEQALANFRDQIPNSRVFGRFQFVDAPDVFPGNNERMPFGDWVRVRNTDCSIVLNPDPISVEEAERTGRHEHSRDYLKIISSQDRIGSRDALGIRALFLFGTLSR